MVHIAPQSIKTKKELKEKLKAGDLVYFQDPSLFDPVSGTAEEILEKKDDFVVTNHPKRSWFARVRKGRGGRVVVE